MKKEKYKWHFQRFLIEHKAYKAFINNVESTDNSFKKRNGIVSVKYLLNNQGPRLWITCGFLWLKTKEGDYFWRKLDYEWQNNIDDLNKL